MAKTTLQASVTKTATFTGAAVAIAALSKPCVWHLKITAMGPDTRVAFQLQVSPDVTPFASNTIEAAFHSRLGPTAVDTPFEFQPKHDYDAPFLSLYIGTANASARVVLTTISGTSPTVTYESWLETT